MNKSLFFLSLLVVSLQAMESQSVDDDVTSFSADEFVIGFMTSPEGLADLIGDKEELVTTKFKEHPDVIAMRNSVPIPAKEIKLIGKACMSPSGKKVISYDDSGTIYSTDLETFDTQQIKYGALIHSLSFDPSGERFVAGGESGLVEIWDSASGESLRTLSHENPVHKVLLNTNTTKMLTITDDSVVHIWDLESGIEITTMKYDGGDSYQAILSSRGAFLMVVNKDHGICRLVDDFVPSTEHHTDKIVALSYAPSANLVVTASLDGTARMWDFYESGVDSYGKCIAVLKGHKAAVVSARFDNSSTYIVTASHDNTAKLWDLEGECLETFEHPDKVLDAAFNDDGSMLITASADKKAYIWCFSTGKLLLPLEGHEKEVYEVGFIGDRAYTFSGDGICALWRITPILTMINRLTVDQHLLVCSIMRHMRKADLFKKQTSEEVLMHGLLISKSPPLFELRGRKALQAIHGSLPIKIKALFEPYVRENIYWLAQLKRNFDKCCWGKRKYKTN